MEGLTKQRLGLYLGPALFVVVMLIPPPASMIDAARAAGALHEVGMSRAF